MSLRENGRRGNGNQSVNSKKELCPKTGRETGHGEAGIKEVIREDRDDYWSDTLF